MQLDAWCQPFKSFNQVVRDPELLQRLPDLVQADDSSNVVSAQGQDLDFTQFRKVDHLVDAVGRDAQLFDIFQLVERVVHSLDEGVLADQAHLSGFSCNLTGSLLPSLDGVSARQTLGHLSALEI